MVPSVRMRYPDGIINFQQKHSSIHVSRVVQEWLSLHADGELIDWPPRAPDMNPIESMWSEVKKTMQETRPVLPPRNRDELWTLCQMRGMKLLVSALRSITDWVHDATIEISGWSTGFLDFLLKRPVSENIPYKGWNINSHFVRVIEILRETKLFKPYMFWTFVYSKLIKVGIYSKLIKVPHGAHFSFGDPRKSAKQTEYGSD